MAVETKQLGQRVGYADLRGYVELLEAANLLKRIQAPVDPRHELGAICARALDRNGPGLLFEHIDDFPGQRFVANILSRIDQIGIAFGTAANEDAIYAEILKGMHQRIPSVVVPTGPCKEETYTGDRVDLYEFPTPVWHELDGGPYLGTTAGVITGDPDTGRQNMGMYRAMIKDARTLTLSVSPHGQPPFGPGGADHILKNEARGQPTPVALAVGMDPLLTLAAGTLVPLDDNGHAEFEVAGGWRGSPTELVRCETSELLVPAHAEIIVEGEVLPGERSAEGPHGEGTGFYGHHERAFAVHVRCITHRRNPLPYGLICRLSEDYPRSLLRSGALQRILAERSGIASIRRVHATEVGRGGTLIVSAEIASADEPNQIMQAAWEHTHYRWVIVVDDDCDMRNWDDVLWRVCVSAVPSRHIVPGPIKKRGGRSDEDRDFTPPPNGLGIDATLRFKDTTFPPINTVSRELAARVAARWSELGLP